MVGGASRSPEDEPECRVDARTVDGDVGASRPTATGRCRRGRLTVRRRRFLAGASAAAGMLAGCTGGGGRTETVVVGPGMDFVFEPGTAEPLTIQAGTTVRFVWDTGAHNIHVDSQPADANWAGHEEVEEEGFVHEHTFDVPGEYHYWCFPHRSMGMVGDIVVEPGGGGGLAGY